MLLGLNHWQVNLKPLIHLLLGVPVLEILEILLRFLEVLLVLVTVFGLLNKLGQPT